MLLKYVRFSLTLTVCLLNGCHQSLPSASQNWQFFSGRDDEQSIERPFLYRALVPSNWIRLDPLRTESIVDTKKAICEFYIRENHQAIHLTFHTFPIKKNHSRIPSQNQVTRWKQQFEELDLLSTVTESQSHGGVSGLFFEGQGKLNGNNMKIMGWSMQLATLYEQQLQQAKQRLDRTKCADYTIKAIGPLDLMNKHRMAIIAFAHSLEYIDELPSPS